MTVKGKMSSSIFQRSVITIRRCDPLVRPSCYNDTIYNLIHAGRQLQIDVPIVQYNINPSNQNYKEIYVEDKNFFMLSNQLGAVATVNLEQSII